jgi:hypothetical protein
MANAINTYMHYPFSELRTNTEYNNSINTSDEGQAYLRQHPEMWQYFDTQQYNANGKASSSSLDPSDLIPRYPASAILPSDTRGNVGGDVDSVAGQSISPDGLGGQYIPNYPVGVGNMYDLSSQPELTEEVKYPTFHAVRKHGKYTIPESVMEAEIAGGMSNGNSLRDLSINVNRRTQQQQQHLTRGISHPQERGSRNEPNLHTPASHNSHNSNNAGTAKNNEDNMMWGNYYPGVGILPSSSDGRTSNDPYGKNRRGRYRYLPQDVDSNQDVGPSAGGGGGGSISQPGVSDGNGINSINDPDPEEENPFHHRWKRNLDNDAASDMRYNHHFRSKRHIGPHDVDGIQRLISTGTEIIG